MEEGAARLDLERNNHRKRKWAEMEGLSSQSEDEDAEEMEEREFAITPSSHATSQPPVSIQPTLPEPRGQRAHGVPQQHPRAPQQTAGYVQLLIHYLPGTASLTASAYLTPNPPSSNATSFLTRGPGGNSSGAVTGQVLQRSSGQHAGTAACQSHPRGDLSRQPALHEGDLWPPAYPGRPGPVRDRRPVSPSCILEGPV